MRPMRHLRCCKRMLQDIPLTLDTLATITYRQLTPLLHKTYFFHDVRITCSTNAPAIQTILDGLLGNFLEPEKICGEVSYVVLCHESAAQFPLPLPRQRVRTDTMRLLTNTRLKYYRSTDAATQYQRYQALLPLHEEVLSVITPGAGLAITQLLL